MSDPEPAAGESASPKPLDDSSPEEEPSNSAPGAVDNESESDVADQSRVEDEPPPTAGSHHTSPAAIDDTAARRSRNSNDDRPQPEAEEASTPMPEASPEERPCGILIRSEIEELGIIQGAVPACFEPASYDLRLGSECVHVRGGDGRFRVLAEQASVSLEPFDRLYFETREVLKLPLYVAGRFDLRVHFAIKGLFVQVGTQVEPGYKGKLFGLIINTSSDPVDVFANKRLLTIEFHYLSGPVPIEDTPGSCYSLTTFLRSREIGESKYKKASVIGDINRRIDSLDAELKTVRRGWRWVSFLVGLFVTFLAVFVTVVVSMATGLGPSAVRQWVGEEVQRQRLVGQPDPREDDIPQEPELPDVTHTPGGEPAGETPTTHPILPGREISGDGATPPVKTLIAPQDEDDE